MNFNELVLNRYSVRSYDTKPIEKEKLELVLNAARLAPSAVNFQPYKIFVVQTEEKLNQVRACYHRAWMAKAPVLLVVVGKHGMGWKRTTDSKDHTDIDCAIAIEHMALQAADLGLGTCWVCNFDVEQCSEVLNLQANEEVVAIMPLGYPSEDNVPVKKRKDLDELVLWV
jgi:nitroreductase